MTIAKTASFRVRPEAAEAVRAAIQEFVAHIRAHEAGTLLYASLRDAADPQRFLHLMIFAGDAAEQEHRKSAAVRTFVSILYPKLDPPGAQVEFRSWEPLATNLGGVWPPEETEERNGRT